jgi:predicted ester cyclase
MEPKEVITELFARGADEAAINEFIAPDMVNHAAGPQGREGWKQILATIAVDLGSDRTSTTHALFGEGELVAHHMTVHGHHQASTMPLLSGAEPSGKSVSWTFIHIWRVVDGMVVEHWACRDDVGLLAQVGAWPPR